MKVVFVDDVKEQHDTYSLVRAKYLYNSDWFREARNYAENNSDYWYILTDEYGLISPVDYISSYINFLDYRSDENIRLQNLKYLSWIRKNLSYEDEIIFIQNKNRCYQYLFWIFKLNNLYLFSKRN